MSDIIKEKGFLERFNEEMNKKVDKNVEAIISRCMLYSLCVIFVFSSIIDIFADYPDNRAEYFLIISGFLIVEKEAKRIKNGVKGNFYFIILMLFALTFRIILTLLPPY